MSDVLSLTDSSETRSDATVEIAGGDVDRTACAGTHVENTNEIDEFEITGRETAGSGEERV